MAPAFGRDRRGARRGSSGVLWVVGAAFALYCVFLLRLQLWTQQAGAASGGLSGGALVDLPAEARALDTVETRAADTPEQQEARAKAEAAARVLERVARERHEAENRPKNLRPGDGDRERGVEPVAVEQVPTAPARADAPLGAKPVVTIVQPTVRPTERRAEAQAAPPAQATPKTQTTPRSQAAPPTQAPPLAQAAALIQAVATSQPVVLEARRAPVEDVTLETEAPKVQQPDALAAKEPAQLAATAEDRLDVAVVPPVLQTTMPPTTEPHVPFRERHQVVAGYENLLSFLESYMAPPGESLFLFFVCSDRRFRPDDWSPECAAAKQHVYSVFAKSPASNRLVTVLAGSERFWKFQNSFYNDPDLRVKGVPCLIKWEGSRGQTSGMMVHETLQYDVFLRYLFKNDDQPDPFLTPDRTNGKWITTINGYEAYLEMASKIKREKFPVKTYMLFVSGRFKANNRPWCPYCRYSELPVEYAFFAFAPPNSRLVRVEVTDSYTEWKHPNKFNRDPELDMHVVPAFYKLQITPPSADAAATSEGSIVFERHKIRLDLLESLRSVFSQ